MNLLNTSLESPLLIKRQELQVLFLYLRFVLIMTALIFLTLYRNH